MVSIWVPVAVATIAAVPVLLGVWFSRRTSSQDREMHQAEFVVSGLVALITELQEERAECRRLLTECLKAKA